MNYDFEIGISYTKDEIASIFQTNFGWFLKSITLRRDEEGLPYIILFTKEDNSQGDRIEGDMLYYYGEGYGRDQTLTVANKALMESNSSGRTIYGFRKERGSKAWTYMGVLEVIEYSYKKKDGFMKFEFKIRITGKNNKNTN